jgi:hypothetical protein
MYQQFIAYLEEQAVLGRSHSFRTETVADYTADASSASSYYNLALRQFLSCRPEPMHSKLASLAEHLIELGRHEEAQECLRGCDEASLSVADAALTRQLQMTSCIRNIGAREA